MKWKKYTIATTTEAVDLIGSMLEEHGIEGIEIEDNVPLTEAETKGMFIDILPELGPDEGKAKVSFYVDEGAEDEALLAGIREGLSELRLFVDVGEGTISSSETEDKDWVNNWKQYFHPFTVDDILIKPTWEEVPKEHADKLMIEIDPGTAFGTGSHETTQLCIRQLQKYLKAGDRVLDIGTGSGILAIAALKLGASFAFGTDVDENAVRAAGENARGNGFSEDVFVLEEGDIRPAGAGRRGDLRRGRGEHPGAGDYPACGGGGSVSEEGRDFHHLRHHRHEGGGCEGGLWGQSGLGAFGGHQTEGLGIGDSEEKVRCICFLWTAGRSGRRPRGSPVRM